MTVRKITPWSAATASTRRQDASSVFGSGGSWSSIFVHTKSNAFLPSRPATMPSMIPIGL